MSYTVLALDDAAGHLTAMMAELQAQSAGNFTVEWAMTLAAALERLARAPVVQAIVLTLPPDTTLQPIVAQLARLVDIVAQPSGPLSAALAQANATLSTMEKLTENQP